MERSYHERTRLDGTDGDIMVTSHSHVKKEKPQEKLMNEQGFAPKVKPRSVNAAAAVDVPGRTTANRETLNKHYVTSPTRVRTATIAAAPPTDLVLHRYRERVQAGVVSAEAVKSRPAAVRSTTKRYVVTRAVEHKRTFPFFTMFLVCVLIASSLFYLFYLNIQADGYKESISSLQSEISSLRDERTLLQVKFDAKYNLPLISQLAVEEYGMVSADSLPKKYVTLASSDSIQVMGEQESDSSSWWSAVSSIFGEKE